MKLFFTLSFLVVTFSVSAQSSKLQHYYSAINKAEMFIVESNWDSSYHYFSQAFEDLQYPFARHVYNAALVAAQLEDYKDVAVHLTYLLKLGASCDSFKTAKPFASFFASKEGANFDMLSKKIKTIYDPKYRKAILAMVKADQSFRTRPNAYKTYLDTIKKIDRRNVDALIELIHKKGFPSEIKIGIDAKDFVSPLYCLIILHQSSGPLQQFDFSEILKENILAGNIENSAGAFMINRSLGYNVWEVVKYQYIKTIDSTRSSANPHNIVVLDSTDWGYIPLTEKETLSINNRRKMFLLDDYTDHVRKILFANKRNAFLLYGYGSNSIINLKNYNDFLTEKSKLRIN